MRGSRRLIAAALVASAALTLAGAPTGATAGPAEVGPTLSTSGDVLLFGGGRGIAGFREGDSTVRGLAAPEVDRRSVSTPWTATPDGSAVTVYNNQLLVARTDGTGTIGGRAFSEAATTQLATLNPAADCGGRGVALLSDRTAAFVACRLPGLLTDRVLRVDLTLDPAVVTDVTPVVPPGTTLSMIPSLDVTDDGKTLVFEANDYTCSCTSLMQADLLLRTPAQLITTGRGGSRPGAAAGSPLRISPTSPLRVAYPTDSNVSIDEGIDVVDVTTGQVLPIATADPSGYVTTPTWSPDGSSIAYLSVVGGLVPPADPRNAPGAGAIERVMVRDAAGATPARVASPALPPPTYANRAAYRSDDPRVGVGSTFLSWQSGATGTVDLALRQDVPRTPDTGSSFGVSWTVTNTGSATARGTTLQLAHTESDPADLSDDPLEVVSIAGADCQDTAAYPGGDDLRCALPDIPVGGSVLVTATLRAARVTTLDLWAAVHAGSGQTDRSRGLAATARQTLEIGDGLAPASNGRIVGLTDSCQLFPTDQDTVDLWAVDPDGTDLRVLRSFRCSDQDGERPQFAQVVGDDVWYLSSHGPDTTSSAGAGVYRQPVAGGAAVRVTDIPEHVPFLVSPDGSQLLVETEEHGRVLIPVAHPDEHERLPAVFADGLLGWFAHGTRLLIRRARSGPIEVIGTDGLPREELDGVTTAGPYELSAQNLAFAPDGGSALLLGGAGPLPQQGRGVFRLDFAEPDGAGSTVDRVQARPSDSRSVASPDGTRLVGLDPDVHAGVEAPRLLVGILSQQPPYTVDTDSIGVDATPGDTATVVGWSSAPTITGGKGDRRPPRFSSPVVRPGASIGVPQRLPDPRLSRASTQTQGTSVVDASDDGSVVLGHTTLVYDFWTGLRIYRRRTNDVVDLNTLADGTAMNPNWGLTGPAAVSPSGAYVAVVTHVSGFASPGPQSDGSSVAALYVIEVATGRRVWVPAGTGNFSQVAFRSDDTVLLVGGRTLTAVDWRDADAPARTSTLLGPDEYSDTIAISRGGGRVAVVVQESFNPSRFRVDTSVVDAQGLLIGTTSSWRPPGFLFELTQVTAGGLAVVRYLRDSYGESPATVVDLLSGTVVDTPASAIDPALPADSTPLLSAAPVTLSPDGTLAVFHVDDRLDGYCGASGVAVRRIAEHRTSCIGSADPYRADRGAFEDVSAVLPGGLLLARTAVHYDPTTATDVRDLVPVTIGRSKAYLPPATATVTSFRRLAGADDAPRFRVTVALPDDGRSYRSWRITLHSDLFGSFDTVRSMTSPVEPGSRSATFEIGGAGWPAGGTACVALSSDVDGEDRYGGCGPGTSAPTSSEDVCSNLAGTQTSPPPGTVTTGPHGWCVAPPGRPTSVHATGQDGSVTVAWKPPSAGSGGVVSGYLVRVGDRPAVALGASVRSFVQSGLTNGAQVGYRLWAVGEDDSRSPVVTGTVTPRAPNVLAPKKVTRLLVTFLPHGRARISWHLPAVDARHPRSGLRVRYVKKVTALGARATSYVVSWPSGRRIVSVATVGRGGRSQPVSLARTRP